MLNMTNTTGSTATDNKALIQSGKMVEEIIKKDQEYPDLDWFLEGEISEIYLDPIMSSAEEFLVTNTVTVPAVLLNELSKNVECRSFHGLFPEIGRAWMTIDHVFYIWNYSSPSEIYTYNDQDQIIVSAGLVKPKRGVFGDHITHVITISTPLQVILLGLSAKASELKVYGTNLHASTDDVQMKVIKGSSEGRIFMIGNNGKPYELLYNHPGYLSKPCSLYCRASQSFIDTLVNYLPQRHAPRRRTEDTVLKALAIDNERKLLYLCTDDSIELIDIGGASGNYRSLYKLTNIAHIAVQMSGQSNRTFNADAFVLDSLHVISSVESENVHLMAITTAGFRLYFSTYADGFRVGFYDIRKSICDTLVLGHIRAPSPEAQQAVVGQSNHSFRHGYYDAGIFLSVKSVNDIADSIYCNSMTYYNTVCPVHAETSAVVSVPTKVWTIKEAPSELSGKHRLKEIARPLTEAPRQFLALTSRSITFYNKLRPVDVLLRMIRNEDHTSTEQQNRFEKFFKRYGKTEACAMCLSIACNIDNPEFKAGAVNLFFQLGGVPTPSSSTYTPTSTYTPFSTTYRPGNHLGQVVVAGSSITFSGKHDGFVLYLARMLQPIWDLKFFVKCHPANPSSSIHCAKIQSLLKQVRGDLNRLAQFMEINPQFHSSANISDPRFQATDQSKLDLDLAEQKSVREAYTLLTQAKDAVYFIEFLLESRIQNALTPDRFNMAYLKRILELDIRSLLTTISGRELASELGILTISQYGSTHTHASFDVVSHQMENFCHNYFGPKDILFFKGMEYVRSAMNKDIERERDASIKESLACFKQAADHLSSAKFRSISDCYLTFSFHSGIIELALERVHQLDPTKQALTDFENGHSGKNTTLATCLETYTYALQALDDALLLKSAPPPPHRSPIPDPVAHVQRVFDTALNSKDQLFHYKLYAWFLEKGLKQELLRAQTPYLVPYFEDFVGDEETSLDFLWEYYRFREEYAKTAQCLVRLANSISPTLKLSRRVELMTMAFINLNSTKEMTRDEAIFAAELREEIQVAKLQQRIQSVLRSNEDNVEAQVVADHLDHGLFEKDVLLEDYASKFNILQSMDAETS